MATGSLVVDNSTFVGNVFQEGVLAAGSAVSISNSTFVGNTFAAQDIQTGTFSVGHFIPNTSGNPGQLRLNGNLFVSNVLSASATCWSDDEVDNGANIFDDVYPGCTPSPLPRGMQPNGASAVIPGMAAQLATAPALNGGSTPTVALLAGSPAINYYSNGDTGVNFQPPSLDQRGLSRPSGTRYDVGAYEYRASVTPPILPSGGCSAVNVGPVNFKRDSAVLTPSAKRQLNSYVSKIVDSMCHTITLNGYAAAPGRTTPAATKHRIKLASARTATVKEYLASALKTKGLTVKFKVNALGAKNPVATNKTELGQRQNRRVEVLVSKLRAVK
jgi:outer membrane protein OmpA-like peptidoglycan-associated protein